MAKSHEVLEEELSHITLPNIQKRLSFWREGFFIYTSSRNNTQTSK